MATLFEQYVAGEKNRTVIFICAVILIISLGTLTGCSASGKDSAAGGALKENEPGQTLSEDEMSVFNSEFFNGETFNMNNMMLSSEYDKPEEIDLFQLFYNGTGTAAGSVSEEETVLLTELYEEAPYLDIFKVTTDEMNAFLETKLGIPLEATQKAGLENFFYLEQYDSFYNVAGDTNFDWCTVTSGVWGADNELILEYTKEYEGGAWCVTLKKTGDGYRFVSNEKID